IIEVNQRTPILRGRVENPSGRLLSNMSVTATIALPAPANEVLVPTTALVEDGRESVVFVQPDPAQPRFRAQHVAVVHRYQDVVHVRNGDRSARPPTGEKSQEPVPLKPGARIVTAGAMELKAALEDLQARRKR